MCKTTISKSDDYNKTSKLWVLTDKKLYTMGIVSNYLKAN